MKTDIKGCSQTKIGEENYENFTYSGKKFVQYDYRHIDGTLFSCICASLEKCREKRDNWISIKYK